MLIKSDFFVTRCPYCRMDKTIPLKKVKTVLNIDKKEYLFIITCPTCLNNFDKTMSA